MNKNYNEENLDILLDKLSRERQQEIMKWVIDIIDNYKKAIFKALQFERDEMLKNLIINSETITDLQKNNYIEWFEFYTEDYKNLLLDNLKEEKNLFYLT